jgi:hypothetical protein
MIMAALLCLKEVMRVDNEMLQVIVAALREDPILRNDVDLSLHAYGNAFIMVRLTGEVRLEAEAVQVKAVDPLMVKIGGKAIEVWSEAPLVHLANDSLVALWQRLSTNWQRKLRDKYHAALEFVRDAKAAAGDVSRETSGGGDGDKPGKP